LGEVIAEGHGKFFPVFICVIDLGSRLLYL
jgi:hypothetical protein